jgi:hypothetical protein
MKIRYRETDKTDEVESRYDEIQGPVLVGHGNPFWIVGSDSPHLMFEALPDPDDEYTIGPDTVEDWELVEATDEERRLLHEAGFPGLPPQPFIVQGE